MGGGVVWNWCPKALPTITRVKQRIDSVSKRSTSNSGSLRLVKIYGQGTRDHTASR